MRTSTLIVLQSNLGPNSSETIPIDQTGFNTNPKGGNRLWRMQWAWFREIDVLKNENLNFDSPQVKIHPNSSETIPIDQTGFDTNPKGGNRLWRMHWAWFRQIDVLKIGNLNFDSPYNPKMATRGFRSTTRLPEGHCGSRPHHSAAFFA